MNKTKTKKQPNRSLRGSWKDITSLKNVKQGVLKQIPIGDLRIDEYQRQERVLHRIDEIESFFNWLSFGVLIVAKRGNFYYILDGQHRWYAAKRLKLDKLPCLVYDLGGDRTKEADAFEMLNTERGPLTSVDRFRLKLFKRDKVAVYINRVLKKFKYKVGPTGDLAVGCMDKMYRAFAINRTAAEHVWSICVQLSKGDFISGELFGVLYKLELKFNKQEQTITKSDISIMKSMGYKRILDEVRTAGRSNGSDRRACVALENLLIRKRRTFRIIRNKRKIA